MSVSNERLLAYAKYMHDNIDVHNEIIKRVHTKMIVKFRSATLEERKIISDIMDADSFYFKEIAVILAENDDTVVNG
jgi:hypothetical protein